MVRRQYTEHLVEDVIDQAFERIASVGVDSGQIMIVDPCYVLPYPSVNARPSIGGAEPDYDRLLAAYSPDHSEPFIKPFGAAAATVVGTLYGDGCYPVYARFVNGRIAQVLIDFEHLVAYEDDELEDEVVDTYDDEAGTEFVFEYDPE